MDPRIERAHAERLRVEAEIRSVYDAAGENPLSAEDAAKVEDLDQRSADLNTTVSDLIAAEKRNAEIDEALAGLPTPAPTHGDSAPEARDLASELRELAAGERRSVEVPAERRDLTKGTATDGAELVPTSFYGQLVEHMVETSGVQHDFRREPRDPGHNDLLDFRAGRRDRRHRRVRPAVRDPHPRGV